MSQYYSDKNFITTNTICYRSKKNHKAHFLHFPKKKKSKNHKINRKKRMRRGEKIETLIERSKTISYT